MVEKDITLSIDEEKAVNVSLKNNKDNPLSQIPLPQIKIDSDGGTISDQVKDAVIVMGARRASENDDFIENVARNFEKGVLTQQEAENMQKDRLKAQEYYIKWEAVLGLVKMHYAQGLKLMRIIVAVMIFPYFIWSIVRFSFYLLSDLLGFINDICNAVFGNINSILLDKDGMPVKDKDGKYINSYGFNIAAKILFGILISAAILGVLLLIIKIFIGIDPLKLIFI